MARWIAQVVEIESPVHVDDVMTRITNVAGVRRVGSRIRAAMETGVSRAERLELLWRGGDFLWHPDMSEPPVRDRSQLETPERKLEFVAPEEIQAAIKLTVERSFSISRDDLLSEALLLLGFRRMTGQARERLEVELQGLISQDEVFIQGEVVLPASV